MKRLASLILVLAMLVSALSFSTIMVSAESYTEENAFLPENQQTIEILNTLGIAQTFLKNYNESANMTRREYCILMKDFLGASFNGNSSNAIPFDDVLDLDPDIAALKAMSELGFMEGYDDNTFRPDEKVTYEDAVTVMVNMVGYHLSAEGKGGYPMGYLAVAASEGLLEGVTPVSGSPITHGEILTLITNFIKIDVLEQVSFGDSVKYQSVEGETILAKNFNVYKGDGIVDGTYETKLDMASPLPEGRVSIGGSVLDINNTNVKKYFGYNVDYYYKLDKSDYSDLICVFPNSENNELIIDVADKGDFSGNELIYHVDGSNKEHKAKIQIGTVTVYNGVAAPFDKEKIENMQEGYLKFLDNDGDNKYDVLFVEDIKYFVVKDIDIVSEILYGKYSLASGDDIIKLDDDTYEVKYNIVDVDGKPMELSQIKEWDVLSVSSSTIENDKIINITVCSKMVKGVVKAIAGDAGDLDYIVIDDAEYKISNTMNNLINAGKINSFELGEEVSVAISASGTVVCFKTDSKFTGQLGYIKSFGFLNISEKEFYIEYLDSNGTLVENYLADEFLFEYADTSGRIWDDKIKVRDSAAISEFYDIMDTCVNGTSKRKVFRFDVDSEGKIDEIELATDATTDTSWLTQNRLALVKNTGTSQYRVYATTLFENTNRTTTARMYRLDSEGIVYQVPKSGVSDDTLYTTSNDMKSFMDNYTSDSSTGYATYKLNGGQFYCYGDMQNELISVVYEHPGAPLLHYTTPSYTFLVTKVSNIAQNIDGERETVIKLTGITGAGKEDTILVRDLRTSPVAQIKFNVGDIVMAEKGADGYVTFRTENAVTYMDQAYNATRIKDDGVAMIRVIKATPASSSSSRMSLVRTNSDSMQINNGSWAGLAYPIAMEDGNLYINHFADTTTTGSSTKQDAKRSYQYTGAKVFVIDSRKNEVRPGTIDEVITVDKGFPADPSSFSHTDTTLIYTIANINKVQVLFVYK